MNQFEDWERKPDVRRFLCRRGPTRWKHPLHLVSHQEDGRSAYGHDNHDDMWNEAVLDAIIAGLLFYFTVVFAPGGSGGLLLRRRTGVGFGLGISLKDPQSLASNSPPGPFTGLSSVCFQVSASGTDSLGN